MGTGATYGAKKRQSAVYPGIPSFSFRRMPVSDFHPFVDLTIATTDMQATYAVEPSRDLGKGPLSFVSIIFVSCSKFVFRSLIRSECASKTIQSIITFDQASRDIQRVKIQRHAARIGY